MNLGKWLSKWGVCRLPLWLWLVVLCNGCHQIKDERQTSVRQGRYAYRGGMANGKYDGYGELRYNDSVVYAGLWKAGKRHGHGVSRDSLGRKIVGLWRADTLLSGTRTDATGEYTGQLNQEGMAEGAGHHISHDGTYYNGYWKDDRRNGFGFASTQQKMQLGEWKANRYLGERLEYTDRRIYGIDISRHQHDIGKKQYPIHWNRLRITHLGTISKKRIRGTVSYPVSFCYIKSTEGTTIRNKYFKGDYRAAKKHGIHCGAYHFFSTLSSGKAQAEYFLRNTYFEKGDLPPVLDVEPFPSQIKRMGGTQALFKEVRRWIEVVEKRIGVKPILYISQTFVNKYLTEAPDLKQNYHVWIARYGEYKPDVHLAIWQLSPDGRVQGITGEVDINVFNGYEDSFEMFLQNETIQ